ncbi:MAG: MltA domain-containing protein [Alcaligenaceae bacterium]|nr:MltA domain-containing protein [Alcaligenaceae bacterium]
MKKIYLSVFAGLFSLALLSCSTSSDYSADEGKSEAEFDMHAPLQVPALSSFAHTAPRALKGQYHPASWDHLPGWQDDTAENLWITLINNCRGLMRPVSGSLTIPARATPQDWQPFCADVADFTRANGENPDVGTLKYFLEQHLQPWELVGRGMATGYYEPIVSGSKSRGGQNQWPMYAPPKDLLTIDLGSVYPELAGKRVRGKVEGNKVVPYDTRAQIGVSNNKPPVIAWLSDPVEAFFLQVQGSGRVQLDNGSSIRLAYADHNGRPYTSIGRWLADQGELPLAQTSMQNIKAWAQQNPHRVDEMLNVNEAMVFFREETIRDSIAGPKGAYGIPLVAQRTVAVDPDYVPLGSPLYLATTYPATSTPLEKVVFAQDTGGAIKGAARVDYYWGSGDAAGEQAGRMKQDTQVWVLWPVGMGEPSAR